MVPAITFGVALHTIKCKKSYQQVVMIFHLNTDSILSCYLDTKNLTLTNVEKQILKENKLCETTKS